MAEVIDLSQVRAGAAKLGDSFSAEPEPIGMDSPCGTDWSCSGQDQSCVVDHACKYGPDANCTVDYACGYGGHDEGWCLVSDQTVC